MSKTLQGFKEDLHELKLKFLFWIWKRITGVSYIKSPILVLWNLIDEENKKEITYDHGVESGPDCVKIEAWQEAIERIQKECYFYEGRS